MSAVTPFSTEGFCASDGVWGLVYRNRSVRKTLFLNRTGMSFGHLLLRALLGGLPKGSDCDLGSGALGRSMVLRKVTILAVFDPSIEGVSVTKAGRESGCGACSTPCMQSC